MPSSVNILSNRTGIGYWLHNQVVGRKLMSPLGFVLLGSLAVAVAYLAAFAGYKMAYTAAAGFVGLVLAVACTLYPYFGFYFCIILSTLIFTPERLLGISLPF